MRDIATRLVLVVNLCASFAWVPCDGRVWECSGTVVRTPEQGPPVPHSLVLTFSSWSPMRNGSPV